MNGWPARSAASRKPHPKHTHPGRGAFCAPAVFAAGEMRLNGSKRRGQRARYHAKLRLPWPRARTPALVGFRLRFAPRNRAAVIGPAFWSCRAKSGAAFRCAPPGRPPASRPWLRRPAPMFWPTTLSLRSSVAPRPKPRRSSASASVLLRKNARPVAGPTGASVLATTPSSACRGPALAPRRSSASASVLLRKNARPVIGPAGADVLAYHAFASLKRGPAAKTPALDILPGHAIILIGSK